MENNTRYVVRWYEVRSPLGEPVRRFRYHRNAVKFLWQKAGWDWSTWEIAPVYYNGVAK